MNPDTHSLWAPKSLTPDDGPLTGDTTCDVCDVGSGMAGLTTAYLLAKEGKKVIILDAKPHPVTGETERTTAQLTWHADDTFSDLADIRGDDNARQAASDHHAAVAFIEKLARDENIDCDFQYVPAYLVPGADGPKVLEDEDKALKRLNIPYKRTTMAYPGTAKLDALEFDGHARFHPIKYLAGLAAAFRKLGGVIHTKTVVEKVRGGDTCTVTTTHKQTVTAKSVVIAANNPFEGGTTLHTKVGAYATYVVTLEVPKGSYEDAIVWDTEDPYHYVRFQPGEPSDAFDLAIVGGADHKTGQEDDQLNRWRDLEAWTREHYPQAGKRRHQWSGQVFETADGLALIGLAPWNGRNVYVVTGDSGMGMTHGTIAGSLLTDLIAGRPNKAAELYSPSRKMPGALKTLVTENVNLAAQYADWVTGGDVKSVDEIPPGQGAVIRRGLVKLAVSKSDTGVVTTLSAVCPHMGCIVHWNPGETSWDCPCHGSRFAADGTCLHGPSVSNLAKAE